MRVDGKQEGPRQSMAWLHTWASLLMGWLLYAIFLTGTLSFFQNEITLWMKPELHQSLTNQPQEQQLNTALDVLQQRAPDASAWIINLPEARQTTTTINIRQPGEDPRARRGGERLTLDTATGEELTARETRGGGFLYRFHFELYSLPRGWARWIVGVATMLMLVAIISGVITHKKIFKDFFTFRPNKGQRSWLDAHNASAVFALPFHIMITFSGLLLLMFTIMPWGVNEVFEGRQQFLQAQNSNGQVQQNFQRGQNTGEGRQGNRAEGRNNENVGQRGGENNRRAASVVQRDTAPLIDIAPLLKQAQQQWPNNTVAVITVLNPNRVNAEIEIRAGSSESLINRRLTPVMKFNGVSGEVVATDSDHAATPVPAAIYNWMTSLHLVRGVDLGLRWIMFLSGVLGTLMIATGLVLWSVKRVPEQKKSGYKPFSHRLVEVLNVATIAGMPIATAAYFWANRFIPAAQEGRATLEINTFFIVWFIALLHAVVRPYRKAWQEQLLIGAALFFWLPLINAMTGGRGLWSSVYYQQWVIASFDLVCLVLAGLLIFAFYKVNKVPLNRTSKKRAAVNKPMNVAEQH